VQNNVQELWAIFDFLMPNYLGSDVEFSSRFGRDISRGQLPGASTEEIQKGLYKLRELHQQVLPFILRREKDQVLHELPPKTITRIPCEMSSVQKELYRNFISKKVTKDAIANLDRILEQTQSNDEQGMMLTFQDSDFSALHTLRLLCTHPSLIDISELTQVKSHDLSSIECSGKLLALNDLLRCSQIAPREVTGADNDVSLLYLTNVMSSSLSERNIDPEFTDDCNKEKLELYMNRSQPSRKCLIYSQFRKSLDIIESNLLKPLMPSLKYLRIDGGVDRQKRDVIVQKFNDDDDIKCLLLTSKVGSLGLNLQAASMVIFIENDWNPHSDRQAMDRAHRLGQSQVSLSHFVYDIIL
jgi:TATA-binding protein-associated factor